MPDWNRYTPPTYDEHYAAVKADEPASSGISGLLPCPFCGGRSFSFTYSEDFGYLLCDPCFAGIGIDLDDLPRYSEIGEPLEDCPAETKQPLIDKWNTRAW